MPFKTKIFDPNGKEITPKIEHEIESGPLGTPVECIYLYDNDKLIGSMTIVIESNHVYISIMANHTHEEEKTYNHVGSFLLEYAFKRSKGKGIELQPIEDSPPFFHKMGLRPRNLAAKTYANKMEKLNKLQKLSPEDQAQLKNAFEKMKIAAAKYLNKKPDEITLNEAEDFGGFNDVANERFETALKNKQARLTEEDCDNFQLQTVMFLTAGMVKKLQLGWDERSEAKCLEDRKNNRNSTACKLLGIQIEKVEDNEQFSTETTLSCRP